MGLVAEDILDPFYSPFPERLILSVVLVAREDQGNPVSIDVLVDRVLVVGNLNVSWANKSTLQPRPLPSQRMLPISEKLRGKQKRKVGIVIENLHQSLSNYMPY